MGAMSLTILDIEQVFGLRPSGRVIDVTHDWAPHSRTTTENSGNSGPIIQLEYNFATFKSHGTSFLGFILFAKKEFRPSSSNANRKQEHMYILLY
ncbi:hypothetical protein ACFX1R_014555 [Malus domestica]